MSRGITVHTVVRNEPFLMYAIRSVYPFADQILLCDTGSTDDTLSDIAQLIREDHEHKIVFTQDPLPDATAWTDVTRNHQSKRPATSGVALIRQEMIDVTTTPYFMLVDGDEVHYRNAMRQIVNETIPAWPAGFLCAMLPITWYCGRDRTCRVGNWHGRLFATKNVVVLGSYPAEMLANRKTRKYLWQRSDESFRADVNPPMAHFEPWVKPWRRPARHVRQTVFPLPEVMIEDPTYIQRFEGKTHDAA